MSKLLKIIAFVALTATLGTSNPQHEITLDPIGFQGDSLSGTAIGTVSNHDGGGTTYVLQGFSESIPFTLTLFEGPSTLSETAALPSLGLTVDVRCGVDGIQASCVDVVKEPGATITTTELGTLQFVGVPVSSLSESTSTTSESRSTDTSTSTSRSSSRSTSTVVTSTSTSTLTFTTISSTTSTSTSASPSTSSTSSTSIFITSPPSTSSFPSLPPPSTPITTTSSTGSNGASAVRTGRGGTDKVVIGLLVVLFGLPVLF